jgi:predicted PurR-regulated permease PerM
MMNETGKMRGSLVRWIALMLGTLVALYLCWRMLQPFIEVLLWAVVLVVVFYPVHKRIEARMNGSAWSAVVSTLIVIVTILVPLTLITYAIVRELTGFADGLQGNIQSLLDPNSPTTGKYLRWIGQYVNLDQWLSREAIVERLGGYSRAIAARAQSIIFGLVGVVIEIFFVIFTMYYLFRDGDRLRAALRFSLPLEGSKANEIIERTREVISASVYGVLVIASIQGALGGLIFFLLGLPSALLWAVVMMFFSMIPMAGAFIVWVPAAIYLLITGEYVKAVALIAFGTLVIGSVDNFLRPKLVGERTRLHELLIFFSVLGGLQVFGVLGLVLGPAVVAVTMALLDVVRHAGAGPPEETPDDTLVEEQANLRDVEPSPASSS